ncbi:MAG: thermonuclease family protein [Pseudomonadota bacterium]|nr:thermonuclease family protein [Pseudomonadota bacterium]
MKFVMLSIGAMLAVFAVIFFAPLAPSASARAETFSCSVIKVHDGDGPIWCSERGEDGKPIKIRLTAIAARELDESCSPGHPCPTASGASAQQTLERLALGSTLTCEATGTSYNRTTAWCWLPGGVELNCAMVKSGQALKWDKFDPDQRLCSPSKPPR